MLGLARRYAHAGPALWVLAATTIANVFAYGYQVIMARLLRPDEYAILTALFGILLLESLSAQVIQTATARHRGPVPRAERRGRAPRLRPALEPADPHCVPARRRSRSSSCRAPWRRPCRCRRRRSRCCARRGRQALPQELR